MNFDLLGIFAAGGLTFLTPCVLPLVPIYLAALVGGDMSRIDSSGRGQLLMRALFFSTGFILVFTLMGLAASSIGSVLAAHKSSFQLAGAFLILLFGLKFTGFIQIPVFDRIVRADDTKMSTRFGVLNALVMGIVFAAGWSPCVGPVLGSVLTYTASQANSSLTGALYLSVYGLGFAAPLLVTALFAQAGIRFLKKINPFLPKIEMAIGLLLVVVAAGLFLDATDSAPPPDGESCLTSDFTLGEDGNHWPVMIELYAEDCPVCKRMKPIVDGIKYQCHGNKVRVVDLDVSKPENQYLAGKHRLVGVPTFIFLDSDNSEVARLVGEQSEEALKQALSALRRAPCPGVGPLPDAESLPTETTEELEEPVACDGGGFTTIEEAKAMGGNPSNSPSDHGSANCAVPDLTN